MTSTTANETVLANDNTIISTFYDAEKTLLKDHYCVNAARLCDGLCESWHKNGQRLVKCTYINGKHNGLYESWYDNGQLRVKCEYENGKMNGTYETWYDNGQQREKYMYRDGLKDGFYSKWYKDGNMKYYQEFVNGVQMGYIICENKNGIKMAHGKYDNVDQYIAKIKKLTAIDDVIVNTKYDDLATLSLKNGKYLLVNNDEIIAFEKTSTTIPNYMTLYMTNYEQSHIEKLATYEVFRCTI